MMKKWQVVTVLSIVGLITMIIGWAWWNQRGSFRGKEYLPEEKQDLLAGVQYIDTSVSFQKFEQFYGNRDWVQGAKGHPDWKGVEISSLTPYIPTDYPLTKTELKKRNEVIQDFKQFATEVIIAEGFRSLPYMTPQRRTIDSTSHARMGTIIRTYKRNNLVVFQMRTILQGDIRAQFTKPTLLNVQLGNFDSMVYAVEEKDALRTMKDVLQKNMRFVLQRYSGRNTSSVRSQLVIPYDTQFTLPINSYGEQ